MINNGQKTMFCTYEEHQKEILSESFTVQELIDALSKYPKDMKIITTWESTIQSIEKRNLYVSKDGKFIYIDADNCLDKGELAKDPNENEEK